jgi:arylsulfatase A-like enzyme
VKGPRRSTGLWLLAGVALTLGCEAAPPPRPNILFVFTDDHAAHAVSAYGSTINRTPNIDRLAAEGVLFRNAFVTNSICAPSRATVLTGQFGHLNGVPTNRDSLHAGAVTFPALLRESGYQTAIIGKWHLKRLPAGFDHYEVLRGQGDYYNPTFFMPGDTTQRVGYTTDVITDRALAWLAGGRDPTRPFMLMYQHKAPHREWAPGPDHLDMYAAEEIPEPSTLFDDGSGRTTAALAQEMAIDVDLTDRDLKLVPPGNLTDEQLERWEAAYGPRNAAYLSADLQGDELTRWKYQRYIKDYLRSVASVDDNLGRVLDYLDRSGLAESTLVVYTSDQGFFLGDHGWFDKRWMYEESLRTPLLARWPGVIAAGSERSELVQNLDLAQTFLDAAGVAQPSSNEDAQAHPLLRDRRVGALRPGGGSRRATKRLGRSGLRRGPSRARANPRFAARPLSSAGGGPGALRALAPFGGVTVSLAGPRIDHHSGRDLAEQVRGGAKHVRDPVHAEKDREARERDAHGVQGRRQGHHA